MSNHVPEHGHDAPRVEPWLLVLASSLVPLAVAVVAPGAIQIALWIVGGALLVAGLAMAALRRRPSARQRPADGADRRSEAA